MVFWKISPQRVWFCILIPVPNKLSWKDGMLHIKARCVITSVIPALRKIKGQRD